MVARSNELPAIDQTELFRFAKALGAPWWITTLPDNRRGAPKLDQLARDIDSGLLRKLQNHQKQGYGVFIAPQRMTEARGREHVEAVRAIHLDLDGAPLPDAFPLDPHAIIETSPERYHVYWLVREGLPVEDVQPIQRWLAHEYGGDTAATDPARIMRAPGTWHLKAEPFRVTIADDMLDEDKYTAHEVRDAFGKMDAAEPDEPRSERAPDAFTYRHEPLARAQLLLAEPAQQDRLRHGRNHAAYFYGQQAWAHAIDEDLAVHVFYDALDDRHDFTDREARDAIRRGMTTAAQRNYDPMSKYLTTGEIKFSVLETPDGPVEVPALGDKPTNLEAAKWLASKIHFRYREQGGTWSIWQNDRWNEIADAEVVNRISEELHGEGIRRSQAWNKSTTETLAGLGHLRIRGHPKPTDYLRLEDLTIDLAPVLDGRNPDRYEPHPQHFHVGTCGFTFDELRNPDPEDLATWEAFVERTFPDEGHRLTVQEWCGAALLPHRTRTQQALYLLGDGATGKGTFSKAIRSALPKAETEGVSIEALMYEKTAAIAIGKRLLVVSEVKKFGELANLKRILGGDEIMFDPKYKNSFTAPVEAAILITANTELNFGEDSGNNSVSRRFLMIPADQVIPIEQRDSRVEDLLCSMPAVVLHWMLIGLVRYVENGRQFTMPNGDEALLRAARGDSNHVLDWVEDRLVPDPDAAELNVDLRKNYVQWADEHGYSTDMGARKFGKRLKGATRGHPLFGHVESASLNRGRGWTGIRIKTTTF